LEFGIWNLFFGILKDMKLYIITILLLVGSVSAFGQKERKFIRQGNRLYKKAVENSDSTRVDSVNFAKAEVDYRKALDKKPGDFKSQFNIGNSLFKQKKWEESSSQFEQILETAPSKEEKGKAWFNYGNAMLGQQKLDESIDAYKNALRNTPTDLEAKYNLEFARKLKQQQQQQQQKNQDQNKDQDKDKKDQNKDQNKQDQNKDQQKKDQQNKDQNKQNQDQNKQQQQQQPKISRQNAEQMLKALQNDERQTQEKVKKAEAQKAKSSRPDQDW
jgi:Ca-activated chloride channel family protein